MREAHDFVEEEDERLKRIIRAELNRRTDGVIVDGYTEFPKRFIGWLAGGLMALAISGIVGAVVMYGQLQSLKTAVDDLRHEFERGNSKTVYRGAPDEPK